MSFTLRIYESTKPMVVVTATDRLKRIDDKLLRIRNFRKFCRIAVDKLMAERRDIIRSLPEHLRPHRGRPKKSG